MGDIESQSCQPVRAWHTCTFYWLVGWLLAASISLSLLPRHHLSAVPVVTQGPSGHSASAVNVGRGGGLERKEAALLEPVNGFHALSVDEGNLGREVWFSSGCVTG